MRGRFARKERSASACVGVGCIVVAWSVLDPMGGLMHTPIAWQAQQNCAALRQFLVQLKLSRT
jgi:hypothetical protein